MTPAEALPFHLCLRLGYLHPDHLLVALTAGQWYDWQQFDRTFCLNVDRDDLIHGFALAAFINSNRKEGRPPVRPTDVMPYRDPSDHELTPEQILEQCGFNVASSEAG